MRLRAHAAPVRYDLVAMSISTGFEPIARSDACVLILGSLPGQKSLAASQYYAHSRNVFWRIMADVYGARGDYQQRCLKLLDSRIAVWDVLRQSERPGSLDANIGCSYMC